MKRFHLILLLLFLLPAGCAGQIDGSQTAGPTLNDATSQSVEAPLSLTEEAPLITPDLQPSETPVDDILKFSFPTPVVEAVSLWRPPLYEVPWSLSPFDHFYFSRPIAADEINWPLPNYRYGGVFFGTDIVHTGIDIPAPRGTTVIAAGKGKVIWAGYGLFYGNNSPDDPYGLAVSIEHDFGYHGNKLYTIYAHMDRIDVVNGQQVDTGTPLGIVGLTGFTTGPHLHFEVRIEDNSFYTTRNPELWIAPPQGWGVLAGDFHNTNGSFLTEQTINIRSLESGQTWQVITYGPVTVHKDEYYQENLVISDLPAGEYEVSLPYQDGKFDCQVTIHPGAVTFLTFWGEDGFFFDPPSTPEPEEWMLSTQN